MAQFLIMSAALLFSLSARTQVKDSSVHKSRSLQSEGVTLSLHIDNGRYFFTYQNGMSRKRDLRAITFNSKKEAKAFVSSIGKAITAEDGVSSVLNYSKYNIRLLTEIGSVFMIVNEKGKDQSTYKITRENYNQLKIL
jgi:hypothetical protein